MNKRFVVAASLALAAASAAAQVGPGAGVLGTVGGNGAIGNVGGAAFGAGQQPPELRARSGIDPRTGAPTAASAPASAAPASPETGTNLQSPSGTPVIDGAVWATPRPNPAPTESIQGQGND